MTSRFVISTEILTQDNERELGSFLSEHGTWWHWLPNTWLLHTTKEKLTGEDIREKIMDINENVDICVIEISTIYGYWGRGPENKLDQIYGWIEKYFIEDNLKE